MTVANDLLKDYQQLRRSGVSAAVALEMLRRRVELLPPAEMSEFVQQVKLVEGQPKTKRPDTQPFTTDDPRESVERMSSTSLSNQKRSTEETRAVDWLTEASEAQPLEDDPSPTIEARSMPNKATKTVCPQCSKINDAADIYCYSCGYLLDENNTNVKTVRFKSNSAEPAKRRFDINKKLVLKVVNSSTYFFISPQDYDHNVIVGRDDGSTLQPDIDLSKAQAIEMGVSRLHLMIQYNKKDLSICIADLNSANGTYLNEQRLHPKELRIVSHGDAIRLGRLELIIEFA